MKPSNVLRLAAVSDLVIAAAFAGTPFLRSRVGLPITLVVAAVIAIGAGVLFVVAARMDR